MAKSKLCGHDIEFNVKENEWVYSDTKESTVRTHTERSCGCCGKHKTKEGHDGCLGTLPNVMNACCGHGVEDEAYIQFYDGSVLDGKEALKKIKEIKG